MFPVSTAFRWLNNCERAEFVYAYSDVTRRRDTIGPVVYLAIRHWMHFPDLAAGVS